jgi:uncharacterized membrane protein YcaP (DUF421 family)
MFKNTKELFNLLISFSRTVILYSILVIIMRLMGKRQIGELQPAELVFALVVADLAAIPMENVDTPLLSGIIPIITLFIAEELLSYISMKSERARGIISGKPSILIQKGKILEGEMRKLRYNINDLLEQLRLNGISNVEDVEFAILETSGQLSSFPIAAKQPVRACDMNLNLQGDDLPYTVIIDGRIHSYNLSLIGLDEQWLTKELTKRKINSAKDVFFAFVTSDHNLHLQLKANKRGV